MLTSLKIISDDMRGRNDLKSKVSTLEELYDFFSENTQKITSRDVIFGAGDILSPGSLFVVYPYTGSFCHSIYKPIFLHFSVHSVL